MTRIAPDVHRRPRRRSDLLKGSVIEDLVVYEPKHGRAFTLNRSARAIWALCDGELTTVEIAARLTSWVGQLSAPLLNDVETSIRALDEPGLLEATGSDARA